jgi:hypothetical protein
LSNRVIFSGFAKKIKNPSQNQEKRSEPDEL